MSHTKTKSSQTQIFKPNKKKLKLDGDENLFQHVRIQLFLLFAKYKMKKKSFMKFEHFSFYGNDANSSSIKKSYLKNNI